MRYRNVRPFGSKILYILVLNGWIKDNNLLLNTEIDSEVLMLRSKSNLTIRVEGKKENLKQSVQQLKMGTLLFLVLVFVSHFGTKFIKQLGASPFIILNITPRSLYHHLDLMILILILDRFYHKMYLIWHLSLLTRLYAALILVFHKKIHFEVFHRWYLHNQLRALKKLFKLSFRISVANYVWFFSLQIYLCLSSRWRHRYVAWNWAFPSSKIPRCLW